MNDTITIVEGLCYLHPHKREIVETHSAMKGVWLQCLSMSENIDHYLAPLLVDDIERETAPSQSVDSILLTTIGKKYDDLRWFSDPIIESEIAKKYGAFGCKMYDALYHRDILLALFAKSSSWRWVVVHPESFKDQQAGMLENLWHLILPGKINMSEKERTDLRTRFLSRFEHYWVADDGTISGITHPAYKNKKVVHETA